MLIIFTKVTNKKIKFKTYFMKKNPKELKRYTKKKAKEGKD